MAYHPTFRTTLFCLFAVAAAVPACAGSWSTAVVLGTNAYSGSVALDSAGNMTSVWYQYTQPNGTPVNQIWASSAAFGHPWSAPVDISGTIGVASGNPTVRGTASGNVTAIYTSPTSGATYVDRPAGGNWGTPGPTNGVNQFYVSNDKGDEGLAWGTGGARPTASTIVIVQRPAGGVWSAATTIASGVHLAFDGSVMAPDGTMAVAWESFDSVCGSRTCKTSNWVMHVSTRAAGAQSWIDSGGLLGPDATQHFGQLAADGAGNLGVIAISSLASDMAAPGPPQRLSPRPPPSASTPGRDATIVYMRAILPGTQRWCHGTPAYRASWPSTAISPPILGGRSRRSPARTNFPAISTSR